MNSSKDELRGSFARGVLLFGGVFISVFAIEFAVEFYRWSQAHGGVGPALTDLSWASNNNAKLVDSLSPIARAYNNVLAMLIATVGLAIPLTANMHTPKLIDLFLKDRLNRIVLGFMALGAANSLFVLYIIGPKFAPMWAYRLAICGAMAGWIVVIPYFFYVVRFLDPSTIVTRLQQEAFDMIDASAEGSVDFEDAQDEIQERLFQIGTLVIKSTDRADRSVAREGIWSLKKVLDYYAVRKEDMGDGWFKVDRADFVGLSGAAIRMINEKRTWFEMQVLNQLLLCYHHALSKAPDAVSAITNINRKIAVNAAKRGDHHAVSASIRLFNTFLRDALNRHEIRSAFDVFYQYRQLAVDLLDDEEWPYRIGVFFVTYSDLAEKLNCGFVASLAGYDLEHVLEQLYEYEHDRADDLLDVFLGMPHGDGLGPKQPLLRAKLIAAGFFSEQGLKKQRGKIRKNLADVSADAIRSAAAGVVAISNEAFWEITDRAVNIDWTPPSRRKHIERFAKTLIEPKPKAKPTPKPAASSPDEPESE